jgi:hypothetical protein
MANRLSIISLAAFFLFAYSLVSLWRVPSNLDSRVLGSAPIFKLGSASMGMLFEASAAQGAPAETTIALRGIVRANGGRSSVIVTGPGGEGRLVSVGEVIAPNTVLKEVRSDHAWVEIDGKSSRIDLIDHPLRESGKANNQIGIRSARADAVVPPRLPKSRTAERQSDSDQGAAESDDLTESTSKK